MWLRTLACLDASVHFSDRKAWAQGWSKIINALACDSKLGESKDKRALQELVERFGYMSATPSLGVVVKQELPDTPSHHAAARESTPNVAAATNTSKASCVDLVSLYSFTPKPPPCADATTHKEEFEALKEIGECMGRSSDCARLGIKPERCTIVFIKSLQHNLQDTRPGQASDVIAICLLARAY